MWLLELLMALNKRESNVWYRIDRVTQIGLCRCRIEHGVDAIHAATPYDAIAIAAARNSLKHGQLFKAVYSQTHKEQQQAIEISRERDKEIVEFATLMQSIVNGKVLLHE